MLRRTFQTCSPAVIAAIYGGLAMFYVFVSDRVLEWFIRDPDTLSTAQTIKGWSFVLLTSVLLYVLVRQSNRGIRRAMRAFVATNVRFRRMVETANEGVWVVNKKGKTIYANRALADIFGVPYDIVTGANQSEFLEKTCADQALQDIPRHLAGETSRDEMCFRRPDGTEAWGLVSSAPFVDRHGKLNGVLRMVSDITEQKEAAVRIEQALKAQQILVNEIDHRVRNTLTGILTLLDITRAETDDIRDYSQRIARRIHAMSNAHAMLLRSIKGELQMKTFIAGVFAGVGEHRIECDGPEIAVPHRAVVPMALALNELKDWSMQHSALSQPDGHVRVSWDLGHRGEQTWLQMVAWQENHHAHGHINGSLSLAEGLVRSDLRGSLECSEHHEGWRCEIHLPGPDGATSSRALAGSAFERH